MSTQPLYITSYNSGLVQNKKPFLIPDQAFQTLENSYVWRDRFKKREGLKFLSRLRRVLTAVSIGNISAAGAGTFTFDLRTALGITATEPDAEFELGDQTTITITIGAPISQTLTDTTGTGILTIAPAGLITNAVLNYSTMVLTLTFSGAAGASAATISGAYYPTLPVMGIGEMEVANINQEDTIYFDMKYAYIWNGVSFTIFGSPTTWTGSNSDFFWTTNWRGTNPYDRLFFATNFTTTDPIRYYNGAWVDFAPLVDAVNVMGQARILLPYYGRLVALNVYEGPAPGVTNNYFNRCRFSQIGDPLQADAWRSDMFGKGGFIDAPVNEEITSAIFFKNTLIVFFEQTTWQLRYVGEYGLPFVWERISSDFGCESTQSVVLFDDGVLAVGDKAIISSNSINCQRIDKDIPDQVFGMNNDDNGVKRVYGVRDFFKELVSWTYSSAQDSNHFYPDTQLIYNYRNNTWAKFRGNITAFGTQRELGDGITWNRDDILWTDDTVFWDDVDDVKDFPQVVCGSQHGFISEYMNTSMDEKTLTITGIDLTVQPIVLTVPDHNLYSEEIIYITDMKFLNSTQTATLGTTLNDNFYQVTWVDSDHVSLSKWIPDIKEYVIDFNFTPVTSAVYTGGGNIALIPRMFGLTKDFNPFQAQGKQIFLSYIDFLTDASPNAKVSIELYVNTSQEFISNVIVGNKNNEMSLTMAGQITNVTLANPCIITSPNHGLLTGDRITIYNVVGTTELNGNFYTVISLTENTFSINADSTGFTAYIQGGIWQQTNFRYYVPGQEYCWHRFYATCTGQFISVAMTYGDDLMNQEQTHQSQFVMNAMVPYVRGASRNIF